MALEAANLTRIYPTRDRELCVLRDVSLRLEPAEALAIMGPSGSGKSTLLHILGTLDRPTSGDVSLDGEHPFALPAERLADFRNRRIGFVFQDHHLLPQCTVLENVLIPTLVARTKSEETRRRARFLLERVGLAERLNHRPAELSGGERQRVAVARALINQPAVVLADEPTGNLDRENTAAVGNLLLELCRGERFILVTVTHSTELARQFPKMARISDGQLSAPATPPAAE